MKINTTYFFAFFSLLLPSATAGAAAATPASITRQETTEQTQIKNIQEHILVLSGMMSTEGNAAGEAAYYAAWRAAGSDAMNTAKNVAEFATKEAIGQRTAQAAWEVIFTQSAKIKDVIAKHAFPQTQGKTMEQVLAAVERLLNIEPEKLKQSLPEVQIYYALAVQEIVNLTKNQKIQAKFQTFLLLMDPALSAEFKKYNVDAVTKDIINSRYSDSEQKGHHQDGRYYMPPGVAKLITQYAAITPLNLFLAQQQL